MQEMHTLSIFGVSFSRHKKILIEFRFSFLHSLSVDLEKVLFVSTVDLEKVLLVSTVELEKVLSVSTVDLEKVLSLYLL